MIIHTFTRNEIQTQDFRRFDRLCGNWPSQKGAVLRRKLDCLCWQIDGYNEAPEELYHIPEVRAFHKSLHTRWPLWLYFLHVSKEAMVIPYLCLVDQIEAVRVDGCDQTAALFDPVELLAIIGHDFCRMNQLFERAELPDELNNSRSDAIIELFCGSMTKNGGAK